MDDEQPTAVEQALDDLVEQALLTGRVVIETDDSTVTIDWTTPAS